MYATRVLPFGQVKTIQIIVCLFIASLLLFQLRLNHRPPQRPSIYQDTEGTTNPWYDWKNKSIGRTEEVTYLKYLSRTHGLTRDVSWFARRIQTTYGASKRLSMTEVSSSFMPHGLRRVNLDDYAVTLQADQGMKLSVGRSATPDQVDASGLLFGVSTTYTRLTYQNNTLIHDWERWLTDGHGRSNGAGLVLALHQATNAQLARITELLQAGAIDATVIPAEAGADNPARYGQLVEQLLRRHDGAGAGGRQAKYLAIVDDDVFFPSMDRLLRKLSKFSPAEEYYIGAPSDRQSDWVVERNTTLTYGGGAVFLTPPMAERVAGLRCLVGGGSSSGSSNDEDDDDYRSSTLSPTPPSSSSHGTRGEAGTEQWDEELYRCVSRRTRTDLHVLPSLYAPSDDELYHADGISNEGYGSGVPALALHHYRNWHRFEAGRGHQVASACGEDCFLQRFRFADGWVLVNGFTLSHYPDGVEAVPLRKKQKQQQQQQQQKQKEAADAATSVAAAKGKGKDASAKDHHKMVTQTSTQPRGAPAVDKRLVIVDDDGDRRAGEIKVVAWRGPKRTWRLLDSRIGAGGEVWQAYVKRRGASSAYDLDDRWYGDTFHTDEQPAGEDSVIVLIWEP
ncbi:uncharacterized protein E0L32_007273 [Thyridium curvatum]|uniref:Glycosyltransferase family 31 protein n=1 Tax=Thyridium curvatum TaxID=1093900 RepID=A0A507B5R3_9PEZI|nr:uncharacterized protein E0L32_007273 [Thyridium curvatum]TPX11970.1 hypothetical protein E0L32_007273 [Thyridium curvatum]